MMNRVVITGLGVISPIGCGKDQFFSGLMNSKIGTKPITSFDCKDLKIKLGGEVNDFHPEKFFTDDETKRMGRSSQFAIAAAMEALSDSGLLTYPMAAEATGVSIGTTMGEAQILTRINETWLSHDVHSVPADLFYQYPCSVIANNLGNFFGLLGPNLVFPTACSSGNYAIGYAYDLIRTGKVKAMLAGGSDSITIVAHAGFHRLMSLANDFCRPFDKNRKGIITSEGCAILVMEDYEYAKTRGANIYAEICGYGLACSAYHMTTPHPDGIGARKAMERALFNSRIAKSDIDYISAHGTGTPANDRAETMAVKGVFGEDAYAIPVSSIKSMLGHTMGAASALEAVSCVLAIKEQVLPPTANYNEPDPECDLDYVPNQAREWRVTYALSNAYAFGGNDSSLVIGKI